MLGKLLQHIHYVEWIRGAFSLFKVLKIKHENAGKNFCLVTCLSNQTALVSVWLPKRKEY